MNEHWGSFKLGRKIAIAASSFVAAILLVTMAFMIFLFLLDVLGGFSVDRMARIERENELIRTKFKEEILGALREGQEATDLELEKFIKRFNKFRHDFDTRPIHFNK